MARPADRSKDNRIAAAIQSGMGIWQIQKALHCDWHRIKRVSRERGLLVKSQRTKVTVRAKIPTGFYKAAWEAHLKW